MLRGPKAHCAYDPMQVNGAVKQDGNTKDMIFSIPKLIEHVSTIMTLEVCSPGTMPCIHLTSSY